LAEAEFSLKMKKLLQILLAQRAKAPGARGWELRRALGKDYQAVVEALNSEIEKLGLTIRVVGGESPEEGPDSARYYVVFKEPFSLREATSSGMSVDDLAALAVAIGYIASKHGKAPEKEVVELLKEKLPGWRVEWNLGRFVRKGYLERAEGGMLVIGWRSRVEVDIKSLLSLLLASSEGKD